MLGTTARGTLTRDCQVVNLQAQAHSLKNLNRFSDLPRLAQVRDAVVVRRSATVMHALLVVAAAYAGALAVNAGVAFFLESGIPVTAPATLPDSNSSRAGPAGPAGARGVDYAAIFERNLFGSEPIAADAEGRLVSAQIELLLRGIAHMNGQGFAVFEDRADGRQDVFGVGERVFDGPRLVAVRPDRAVLLYRGRKHTIELSEQEPRNSESAAADTQQASDGIRKTGVNTYVVDRREVEHAIENLNSIVTQMRAVPFMKDGKSLGFRIFNIRPGSLFQRMGLKNGDVVQSVNGIELDSPSQAVALLDSVQSADEIRINLLRNKAPSTLSYAIR